MAHSRAAELEPWSSEASAFPHPSPQRLRLWREEGIQVQVTRDSQCGTFLPQALLGTEGRRGVRAASVALEELKGFIQTQCLAWTPRQTMASKLLHIQLSLLQRDSSLSLPFCQPPPNAHLLTPSPPSPCPHAFFFLNPTFSRLCSDCEHQRVSTA